MSPKYIVLIIAVGTAMAGCGDGPPEVNATNCSGGGMQSLLPTFGSEAERQKFIDECEVFNAK